MIVLASHAFVAFIITAAFFVASLASGMKWSPGEAAIFWLVLTCYFDITDFPTRHL